MTVKATMTTMSDAPRLISTIFNPSGTESHGV